MKSITKLMKKAIWQRLWQWVRYHPSIELKTVKERKDKLKDILSAYGTMGYWCAYVDDYSERDGKGNHIDMVEIFLQRWVHVGIHNLNTKITEKEKAELINIPK